jgi:protein-tyrosine phosphatase
LKNNNIQAIINCTEKEPFHEFFKKEQCLRIEINDSKDEMNLINFQSKIFDAIRFIDYNIKNNKSVFVHCYWGLMRSATIVCAYIMIKYNLSKEEAINLVKEQRPYAMNSLYNFNEILDFVDQNRDIIKLLSGEPRVLRTSPLYT